MTRPLHHLRRHRRRRQVDPHRGRSPSGCAARGQRRRLHARAGRHAARRAPARAACCMRRWTRSTETLLVFAARRDHIERRDRAGARRAATTVLCDRFTDATFAYQGAGRGQDERVLRTLEAWVQRGPAARPDALVRPRCPRWRPRAAPRRAPPTASKRQDLDVLRTRSRAATWRGCSAAPGRIVRIDSARDSARLQARRSRRRSRRSRHAWDELRSATTARTRRVRRAGCRGWRRRCGARSRRSTPMRCCIHGPGRRRPVRARADARPGLAVRGRPIARIADRPCGRCASCQLRRGALASGSAGARARGAARSRSAGSRRRRRRGGGKGGKAQAEQGDPASRRCARRSPSRTTTSARGRGKVVVDPSGRADERRRRRTRS